MLVESMAKGMLIACVISILFIALWASLPRVIEVSDTSTPTMEVLPNEWRIG
jgi:hypothetical protein